jgi:predicted enzyme related to lactoylglutathione lyase
MPGMPTRDEYPAGAPCWVETFQPEPRAALGFYGSLFGWDFSAPRTMPGGLAGDYFVARIDGRSVAGVGAFPAGGPAVAVWNTQIRVDAIDAAVDLATANGATLMLGPVDASADGRLAVLVDPTGAAFSVWEPRGRAGAQLVNEPRAWTMSSLHTPAPDRAAAFYGAVFGWQTQAPAPAAPVELFRLPGYVGGVPGQPMPRDVVAVMASTAAGPEGSAMVVPPHWNVNIQVDDTDAVATRAARLGGTILMPPTDAPGFRSAVLLDPQGAAFSISQIVSAPGAQEATLPQTLKP